MSKEKKAKNDDDGKIKLSKPYDFEGVTYTEIDLEPALETLSGKDFAQVKKEWAAEGNFAVQISTDPVFCAMIACRALGLDRSFAEDLPLKDYTAIQAAVQGFLLG